MEQNSKADRMYSEQNIAKQQIDSFWPKPKWNLCCYHYNFNLFWGFWDLF